MNKFFDVIFSLRYVAILAVIAPVLGAVLMLFLGALDTVEAYAVVLGIGEPEGQGEASQEAVTRLVASIDHFLFAAILIVFAIGLYTLFFRASSHNAGQEEHGKKLSWKTLRNMGGMDEMLLKVIIMLLAVNFLEYTLISGLDTLDWTALVIPLAIIGLAIGLKLMSDARDEEQERELVASTIKQDHSAAEPE